MDQGNYYLKRRDNLARDLITARQCFRQAYGILESIAPSDLRALVRVYYGLMNVEMDLGYYRDLGLEKRESHLRSAEDYGNMALETARKLADAGTLAKVTLERAVLKGRRAEFEAKRGTGLLEVRRLRDEAIQDLARALQEVQEANPANVGESFAWAKYWRDRLKRL